MNLRVPSGRDANLEEKTISTERVFEGKMIKLRVDTVALPNGSTATREVIEHPGAVAVIALTGQGELLMVRQYRHATGEILLEIPAGKRDPGEESSLLRPPGIGRGDRVPGAAVEDAFFLLQHSGLQ